MKFPFVKGRLQYQTPKEFIDSNREKTSPTIVKNQNKSTYYSL
jgi:hypothetical protein